MGCVPRQSLPTAPEHGDLMGQGKILCLQGQVGWEAGRQGSQPKPPTAMISMRSELLACTPRGDPVNENQMCPHFVRESLAERSCGVLGRQLPS
jgi:hypothetical protein